MDAGQVRALFDLEQVLYCVRLQTTLSCPEHLTKNSNEGIWLIRLAGLSTGLDVQCEE